MFVECALRSSSCLWGSCWGGLAVFGIFGITLIYWSGFSSRGYLQYYRPIRLAVPRGLVTDWPGWLAACCRWLCNLLPGDLYPVRKWQTGRSVTQLGPLQSWCGHALTVHRTVISKGRRGEIVNLYHRGTVDSWSADALHASKDTCFGKRWTL